MRSFKDEPCRSYAGGLVGKGCVGFVFSPGTVDCSTDRSTIGQIGVPVTRSNTYRNACLVGCATALIVRPSIVISTSMGAHGMSESQIPWCTSWKCHLR